MKEILQNIALIDTTNYCIKNEIDCSGTHIYKYPRRFTYALLNGGRAIVTVTYYKNKIPSYFVHNYNK